MHIPSPTTTSVSVTVLRSTEQDPGNSPPAPQLLQRLAARYSTPSDPKQTEKTAMVATIGRVKDAEGEMFVGLPLLGAFYARSSLPHSS